MSSDEVDLSEIADFLKVVSLAIDIGTKTGRIVQRLLASQEVQRLLRESAERDLVEAEALLEQSKRSRTRASQIARAVDLLERAREALTQRAESGFRDFFFPGGQAKKRKKICWIELLIVACASELRQEERARARLRDARASFEKYADLEMHSGVMMGLSNPVSSAAVSMQGLRLAEVKIESARAAFDSLEKDLPELLRRSRHPSF